MTDLLLAALETFPNFVVVDSKARIVYLNQGYARLLGTTVQDAVGRPVNDVIPDTRLHIVLRSGIEETGSLITLFDHTVGENVTFVCNRIPIRRNGKIVGAVAATTIRDLLDVSRLNKEIEAICAENQRFRTELEQMKNALNPLKQIIGQSSAVCQLKKSISEYADSNLTILFTGETGVGKEVFAQAVHKLSRPGNAYVKLNCAAIPAELLESELFGYAEGAFTGAARGGKLGKFQLADHGTLLLDEIGEMSLNLQSKLLRVLQEKEIEQVGGTKSIKLDVRIICATNQNLEKLVREGRFREDLYYRINVVDLHIPPLRERQEDIPPLCKHFIEKVNTENGYAITEVDQEALALFQSYVWPGNIRELEHVILRAAVRCRTGNISLQHVDFLSDKISRTKRSCEGPSELTTDRSLRERTQETERDSIIQALEECKGNKTRAAQMLGIDRTRLYHKLRKYQLL